MNQAQRISAFADVDIELAELVVRGAQVHRVSVKCLRGDLKHQEFVRARRWIVVKARPRWSWWQLGRALNRDHSTLIHHFRVATANDRRSPSPGCCGACDLRPDDPRVRLCSRTECPLGHHRRRADPLGAAADKVCPA
jgi:hypothetical protein